MLQCTLGLLHTTPAMRWANKLTAVDHPPTSGSQAGGNGDSKDIAVPAALSRLFKHPVLDWGLMTQTQKPLFAREVRGEECWGCQAVKGANMQHWSLCWWDKAQGGCGKGERGMKRRL